MRKAVVVGDVLLDHVATDLGETQRWRTRPSFATDARPILGGAWRTAVALHQLGWSVELVTATPTGFEPSPSRIALTVASGAEGQPPVERIWLALHGELVQVNHGDRPPTGGSAELVPVTTEPDVVVVEDYGQGSVVAASGWLEAEHARGVPLVWDPHPGGPQPISGCTVVTNRAQFASASADPTDDARALVRALRASPLRGQGGSLVVTLGSAGCLVSHAVTGETYVSTPFGSEPKVVGAGDVFAAALASALADVSEVRVAASRAVNEAGRLLRADRSLFAVPGPTSDIGQVDLVVTSGCFDLLHLGHASLLAGCRRLGHRVVVLLNSDASVRRIKGDDRPFMSWSERATALRRTGLVDDVLEFDEDTPQTVLATLPTDIYVKGADYLPDQVPEAVEVEANGGCLVTVPLIDGLSTSAIGSAVLRGAPG